MEQADKTELLRELPSTDELLRSPALAEACAESGSLVSLRDAARAVMARLRAKIQNTEIEEQEIRAEVAALPAAVEREHTHRGRASLRTVINASGVILHTNLGRAPLARTAIDAIAATVGGYNNLEFDLFTGERGSRDVHAQHVFARIFGAEVQTIVVNNCAAANLLALSALARGGEVIVSRGELVEIGGAFRIPEVMARSGAALREVGTTNRTRIGDYEGAITGATKLLMRVSRSNFSIVGFTEQPSLESLVALGRKHKVPVFEDHGNGGLVDLRDFGVRDAGTHTVQQSIAAGVDVVAYSGDKLLGGPQAGMLTGAASLIARMRADPLFRALRVDKLTYAALEATLLAYVQADYARVPALRMLRLSAEEVGRRAAALARQIEATTDCAATLVEGESVIGGGTPPEAVLPTTLISLYSRMRSADDLVRSLRAADTPVLARIEDDRVLLDLRTVFPEQEAAIVCALQRCALQR